MSNCVSTPHPITPEVISVLVCVAYATQNLMEPVLRHRQESGLLQRKSEVSNPYLFLCVSRMRYLRSSVKSILPHYLSSEGGAKLDLLNRETNNITSHKNKHCRYNGLLDTYPTRKNVINVERMV